MWIWFFCDVIWKPSRRLTRSWLFWSPTDLFHLLCPYLLHCIICISLRWTSCLFINSSFFQYDHLRLEIYDFQLIRRWRRVSHFISIYVYLSHIKGFISNVMNWRDGKITSVKIVADLRRDNSNYLIFGWSFCRSTLCSDSISIDVVDIDSWLIRVEVHVSMILFKPTADHRISWRRCMICSILRFLECSLINTYIYIYIYTYIDILNCISSKT